jgi:hypothetical protein
MSDNHGKGGTEGSPKHKNNEQTNQKTEIPGFWRGVLALGFAIYGVITGSHDNWRSPWVMLAIMFVLFFGGFALNEWLHERTSWHGDNVFLVSGAVPGFIGIIIAFAYIITWPVAPRIAFDIPPFHCEEGSTIAGIKWRKGLIGLTIDITSHDASAKDFDFTITLDRRASNVLIEDIRQITTFPGFVAFPVDHSRPVGIFVTSTNGKGDWTENGPADGSLCSTWRVRCDTLIDGGTMRIVVASMRFGTEVGVPPPVGPITRIEINGTYKSPDSRQAYPLKRDLQWGIPPAGAKPYRG